MDALVPLLHQDWSGHPGFHGSEWGFFHPALLWIGLLLFFSIKRRWGWPGSGSRHSHHGGRADRHGAEARPDRREPAGDPNAPVWPDLYPDAPGRPAPRPEKTELI